MSVVVRRARIGDYFGRVDGIRIEVVDEHRVDDSIAQILDFGFVDLDEGGNTLRMRLIHCSIWERLPGSTLDLYI